ncbi:MAG TPA: IPT/TIG domain-containing protein [Gemmatimonadaceae bacterium]|nr:IPT/TIG domain-containing protein [Gemmatimonadaceae bacterium]
MAVASAVIFTLPSTHLVVGDSVPATATVLDANGVVIDSAPVVWSNPNPSVATVSSYGEVYGKGAGIGRIVAKSGTVADTVVVTVDVAATITIDSITPHQLIAGQTATLYGHQFSSIPTATVILIGVDSLAPTAADSTHLVFVLPDTSCSPAGTRTITVKSRGSAAQLLERFAPGTPAIALPVGGVQAINASTTGCLQFAANASAATYIVIVGDVTSSLDAGFGFELTQVVGDSAPLGFHGYSRVRPALRANAHRAISPRAALVRPMVHNAKPSRSVPGAVASEASAVHKATVGDAVTYNVPLHGCDSAVVTHGHVMAVGTHAIIAQDDSSSNSGVDFAGISADVDASIYPTDSSHFGIPSDIDGNGHVILYYTPQVAALTSGDAAIVGGFFFRGDLFPTSTCGASNQAEILYLSPPTSTRGTIAHVLEHLINASNHIRTNATAFEDTWLDEALAHAAEDFVGRAVDGYSDTQLLTFADISNGPNANAYASYFQGNAGRYASWIAAPQLFGAADTTADTSAAARGAAWTLLRYTFDQYANGSPATLSRALAAGPNAGIYNLVSATGTSLDSLIEGWLVATYATGFAVAGVAPRYTFTSYNWQDIETQVTQAFGLSTTPFAAGATGIADSVQANSGFYLTMANLAPTVAFSTRLLSSAGTVVTLPGARLYILRIQ